jgi:hypothetical protein
LPIFNTSETHTLLIFHNPVATRARYAACGGISPASPGSAQASLARRARNVKNFHCLIYNGIVKNSEVKLFSRLDSNGIVKNSEVQILSLASAPKCNTSETHTPLIFHNPVTKRAFGIRRRRISGAKRRRAGFDRRQTRDTCKFFTS